MCLPVLSNIKQACDGSLTEPRHVTLSLPPPFPAYLRDTSVLMNICQMEFPVLVLSQRFPKASWHLKYAPINRRL